MAARRWVRPLLLTAVPLAVAALVALSTGDLRSGLVIGAGVGFGLAGGVFFFDRAVR